ncbi:uncharacterized protein YwgA [Lachnospiraceae bacterium PF1-22]
MDTIDIARSIIFQRLNAQSDLKIERHIIQNKIYLLHVLGVDLGYMFAWDERGPYSKKLAHHINGAMDAYLACDYSMWQLQLDVDICIQKVEQVLEEKTQEMNVAQWTELLASLAHILYNKESWKVNDKEGMYKLLNGRYGKAQCQYAYEALQKQGMLKGRI